MREMTNSAAKTFVQTHASGLALCMLPLPLWGIWPACPSRQRGAPLVLVNFVHSFPSFSDLIQHWLRYPGKGELGKVQTRWVKFNNTKTAIRQSAHARCCLERRCVCSSRHTSWKGQLRDVLIKALSLGLLIGAGLL